MREKLDVNAPAEASPQDAQALPADSEGMETLRPATPVWQWLALGLLVFA